MATTKPSPAVKATRKNIDRLGELEIIIAAASAEAKAIREAIKDSGDTQVEGYRYVATVSECEVTRLDAKKVKALLTPKQIVDCSTTGLRVTVDVKLREPTLKVIA